jgi:UPF0042 nucleotide-binding protein
MPIRLVMPLLDHPGSDRSLALGLDMRNRDFSPQAFLDLVGELELRNEISVQIVYLDCREEEILRRYSSTRRRHPIAEAPDLAEGIAREIEILRPIAARADIMIDTSDLNPHELRVEIEKWFAPRGEQKVAVQVQSFSYKRGLPRGADLVFDCRFLRNPHWDTGLRIYDGLSPDVQKYISDDLNFEPFLNKVCDICLFILPAVQQEGKSYLTIAFGCTGGRHRSVTVAERLSHALEAARWQVSVRHRELDRHITSGSWS